MDLIKLDYVTPGSPDNGGHLPANNSGSVIAYHNAIKGFGGAMRLDISWKLERNSTYLDIWEANADSMRTDQDINNSGSSSFVAWKTVQRAIENYRDFISGVVAASDQPTLTIHPDLDNLYVGNNQSITGVSDSMRETIATHWIGAGANLISGSDMTKLDALGIQLLSAPNALNVAEFTAQYPMQPRNPGTGQNKSQQLQAWIAGPSDNGTAVVVLANYGPDQGQGGFGTTYSGPQGVKVSWADLGIQGSYHISNVWTGADLGVFNSSFNATLDEGESQLLMLTPVNT